MVKVKESRPSYLAHAVGELVATAAESSFEAATFFEKFELLAETPGAVERLRGVIRNLAVEGRLLASSANIGTVKLKKLATKINSGATPKGGRNAYVHSGVPLIRSMNVHFHGFVPDGLVYLTDAQAKGLSNAVVNDQDVLLNITGASIGRVTVAPEQMDNARVNQHVTIIRPIPDLSSSYLALYLSSPRTQQFIDSIQVGATRQALTKGMIENFEIQVPPLAEQKRIVAKVDELMGLCDRLEALESERQTRHAALSRAALARFADSPTPTNLQFLFHNAFDIQPSELRKSILDMALRGVLVSQRSSEVLNELAIKARANFDLPYDVPENWIWANFGSFCDLINGDRSKNYPNKSEYVADGVPWINTGHIEPDGTLDLSSMHHILREKFDSLRSGKIQTGDLLYCLRGATFGKTAIVTQFDEGAIASSLVIVRLSPHVDSRFAYFYLTSPIGREQIFRFDNGSAQPNLSANSVKKYHFPLPPLAEQKRIVAKVDELMALVDTLEKQLAHSRSLGQQLLKAVVAELTKAQG